MQEEVQVNLQRKKAIRAAMERVLVHYCAKMPHFDASPRNMAKRLFQKLLNGLA